MTKKMMSGLSAIFGIPGMKPEQSSGDHENNGIGNLKLSRQRSKRHHEEQQQQENQFHRLDVARQA